MNRNAELAEMFKGMVEQFGFANKLQVRVPNSKKPPPKSDKHYLRYAVLPVPTPVVSVCGEGQYQFILQMDVYARAGYGETESLRYADLFAENVVPVHSTHQTPNHCFKVMVPAVPVAPLVDDAWQITPVSCTVETIN